MTNDLHSNVELPEHVVGGVRLRTTGLLERMEEQDTSLHQAVALMFDLGRGWGPPNATAAAQALKCWKYRFIAGKIIYTWRVF